jgi:cytochrome c peroxidase
VKRLLAALAVLALSVAARQPWTWDLPEGVRPPPVPVTNQMTIAKVELGRRLFYDADLSANGTMACAACHEQRHAFADSNETRPGVHGDPGRRNVPGLANVAWFSPLTYANPRVTTLEAQVLIPLAGDRPVEMGMKGIEAELGQRLGSDPCYRKMFRRAFPGRGGVIDSASISAAVAAFERTMTSFGSRYDQGSAELTPTERQGAKTFVKAGCASCHSGPFLSDMTYHRLASAEQHDLGVIEITGLNADAGRFRTPSLRNVAVTGPWWHDGTARTLEDAIRRHPEPLSDDDVSALISFFGTLSDDAFITDRRLARPDRACGKRL